MREGWTYKKLGEVGNVVTGSTPSTKDAANYASPDYCFVKPSDLPSTGIAVIDDSEFHISAKAFESARQLPKGSIVVSCIGIIGKVGILNKDACTNQQINAIIPNGTIMPKCLAYIICYKKSELEQIANAPVVPIINKGEFSKFLIPVPPISEQQAIVSELDKINELISLKKTQLSDLDALAQSIFYDMFGDPIENEKGWEVKKLGEVTEPTIGLTYKPENVMSDGTGTIVLRSSNIQDSKLDFNDIVRVNIHIKENKYVKDGDILMCSRNGSFKLVGKVAMIHSLSERMSYGAFMTIIRSECNPYLFGYFKTSAFREYLIQGKTTTVNQITVQMLKDIKLPLPPLSLQQDFAKRIELIEQQKAQISSTIKDLETLLASRMQYWFD